ncbi:MAG: RNA 2',3'-cyclic phosphodiesterase [Sulfuricella sp.]|nr:RNA 2',3'-cyclic phosphodiesterase [Sulfuricella sp.]
MSPLPTHPLPATQRLFFALWPTALAAAGLARAGKRLHEVCGGRRTRKETIHLTLVFLGDVEVGRIDELLELAGDIAAPPFRLDLGQYGWWPHNRIVWAAPDGMPAELAELVDALRERLAGAGFRFDAKPFVPHVTLLRKAVCKASPLAAAPVAWRVRDFVLVRSASNAAGAAYEVIGRWPLARSAAAR